MIVPPKLFGSEPRSKLLVALALLGETFPSELARVIGSSLITTQRILRDLERESIVASRQVGRNRMVSLNPRMYGAAELVALLEKYARRTDVVERIEQIRRRPRRPGKEF